MRNAFHVTISLLMWCLFGYYWYIVGTTQINRASIEAMGVLGLIAAGGLLLTIWWVAHNKKLARRNRRNSAPKTPPETLDEDYLGRVVDRPEMGVLKKAQQVEISLEAGDPEDPADPGRKIYTAMSREGS